MNSKRLFETYNTKFDFEFHIWNDSISTMHGHDFYEFALCDGGEIIYYKNNNPMTIINVKQAVFVTPDDRHSLIANRNKKNTRHINISVKKEAFEKLCDYYNIDYNKAGVFEVDTVTLDDAVFAYFSYLLDKILRLDEEKDKNLYLSTLKQMVECLIYAFMQGLKSEQVVPAWLQQFLKDICTPDSFKYRLYDLYNLSNYSQPVISNTFQKYYKTTLIDYFTHAKITYACRLLKNTNIDLIEISGRLGFSSLSHFNHTFKKIMHTTPSKYRKG